MQATEGRQREQQGLLDGTAFAASPTAGATIIWRARPNPVTACRPGHEPDLVVQGVHDSPHVRPALRVGVPGCYDQLLQLLDVTTGA